MNRTMEQIRSISETIDAMKNLCMENYDNGADTMVEC